MDNYKNLSDNKIFELQRTNKLPYNGSLQDAMISQDRDAIRILMRLQNLNKDNRSESKEYIEKFNDDYIEEKDDSVYENYSDSSAEYTDEINSQELDCEELYSDEKYNDNKEDFDIKYEKEVNNPSFTYKNNDIFVRKKNTDEEKLCFTNTPNSTTTNTISIPEYSSLLDNTKQYYSYKDLSSKISIIEIFYSFDLIIFTDDYKLRNKVCFDYINFFKKTYVSSNDFPGIGFLSIDAITLIKKEIAVHNRTLQDSDNENGQNLLKFQICFDEGDFYKNMVYKKLQVHDKYLFVPYSKYQLKLTEYKLRSFCQIMEELGAIEIEIDFNHINLDKKSKNIKLETEEFNYIAGSLGFSASKGSSSNEEITYKLTYPHNNTLILNEKNIISRIEKGKFIINKKTFDSNLELQFIITSRCRHFIENYSTVFTLDNSINYDKKMISKLKSNDFNCGFEYESKTLKKLKITINTKVKFCSQKDIGNNLLGNNVSFDATGFNYLMTSLDKDKFNTIGIYKIISFIDKYIEKVIKRNRKEKDSFSKIKKLYFIINKEFSFQEFKDLLLDYFNHDSQWINFLNFINVLKFKSVSYNKLGFLILMSQEDMPIYEKNLKVIDFIRHLSEKKSIEDQFWEMLEPNNYFLIVHKLDKEYNILRKFNWFNVQKLIRDIGKFHPNLKDDYNDTQINCDILYGKIYTNFNLGHNNAQYDRHLKPFLYKYINYNFKNKLEDLKNISNNELFFSNYILSCIKPRHFVTYELNSLDKVKSIINHKFNQLEESCKFFVDINTRAQDSLKCNYNIFYSRDRQSCDTDITDIFNKVLKDVFCKDTFRIQYPYLFKKFSHILDNIDLIPSNSDDKMQLTMVESEIIDLVTISISKTFEVKKVSLNIIKKLLIYDINIANHDYTRANLTESYYNYINEYVRNFDQNKICFIKVRFFVSLCNFIINQNYPNKIKKDVFFKSEILILHQTNDFFSLKDVENKDKYNLSEDTINLIKNIIQCYNYKHLLKIAISFLNIDLKFNIIAEAIELLD